ncbi:MAG: hypothetical protein JNL21_35565 [Myxococcales bacterium]|nr:hypothetical protein [Myxococcales bacterium]
MTKRVISGRVLVSPLPSVGFDISQIQVEVRRLLTKVVVPTPLQGGLPQIEDSYGAEPVLGPNAPKGFNRLLAREPLRPDGGFSLDWREDTDAWTAPHTGPEVAAVLGVYSLQAWGPPLPDWVFALDHEYNVLFPSPPPIAQGSENPLLGAQDFQLVSVGQLTGKYRYAGPG